MFHAFIIKLFAHTKPSLFIAIENEAPTWHFYTSEAQRASDFSAQSWSSSTNLPARSVELIFDFLTCVSDTQRHQ